MNYIYKIFFLILVSFLLSACGSKQLTVQSLSPSLLHEKKIYNIILEGFLNDDVNQVNYLEEKLANMIVENTKVFNLQNTYENIDAIIAGEVLDSSLFFDFYYDYERDYSRCTRYEYKKKKRTSTCLEYKERRIPCEKRTYSVETKIQVLNQNEEIIFSKIYSKVKRVNECFKNRHYYNPIFYRHLNIDRKQYYYNSLLAKAIAEDFIIDISPHYIYQNITIIEELEDIYTNEIKEEFNTIVEFLYNKNINISNTRLNKLNIKLERESYEVLYNLALSYEAKNQLEKAKELYLEARYIFENHAKNIEHLELINKAITRVQKNLENKIKAKSQLP